MTEYAEKFSTFSNTGLLKIINNPEDYQPLAVETAKAIFAARLLSEQDIEITKNELAALQAKEKKNQKDVSGQIKKIASSIIGTINPIQKNLPSGYKTIKIISFIFLGLFLLRLYKELDMIGFMLADSSDWDISFFYFLPFLYLPTAIILFYKHKKIGWTLMTIFLTYSALSSVGLFILTLNKKPSAISAFDNIFSQASPTTHILTLIFFGAILWTLIKENIREIYTVDQKYMLTTIGIVATITVFVVLGLYTAI